MKRPTLWLGALTAVTALWASACSGGAPSTPTTPTPPIVNVEPTTPTSGAPPTTPTTPTPPEIPIGTGIAVLNAIGDIGYCGSAGVPLVGRLLQTLAGAFVLAGDIAYMNGRIEDFRNCFDPDFGRFRGRFRPVPGNHEWDNGVRGDGYFTYFGSEAGPARRGYYSFQAAAWLVLMLNSNEASSSNSVQYAWAREEIRNNPSRCLMAVWHHPFASSGPNGPTVFMRDMWQLLYDNRAEVVVSGHDHFYERFGPQDAAYQADRERGIRQFVAGTGGAPLYKAINRFPNSELIIEAWGALRLTLHPTSYEWEFIDARTSAISDRGSAQCH